MAGTDRRRKEEAEDFCRPGPVMVLVEPQLGENIGMVCRAMLNCGLMELRMVKPRADVDWEKAEKSASGAVAVLQNATYFDTTEEAIADLQMVYATTARTRAMTKPVVTARHAADEVKTMMGQGKRCGVLFGKESKGLNNDDVALSDAVLHLPLNPAFASLNLAQAVLLIGYEWFAANDTTEGRYVDYGAKSDMATKEDITGLFGHLESELDKSGFLRVAEKRPVMVRNIRAMFTRCELTLQEVNTLRGIIKSLVRRNGD